VLAQTKDLGCLLLTDRRAIIVLYREVAHLARQRAGPQTRCSASLGSGARRLSEEPFSFVGVCTQPPALRIRKEALPAGDPDLGWSFNNIAIAFRAQRRPWKARQFYHRLAISFGATEPEGPIAIVLNKLGVLRAEQKRYPEARAYYQHALAIRAVKLPGAHPYARYLPGPSRILELRRLDSEVLESCYGKGNVGELGADATAVSIPVRRE